HQIVPLVTRLGALPARSVPGEKLSNFWALADCLPEYGTTGRERRIMIVFPSRCAVSAFITRPRGHHPVPIRLSDPPGLWTTSSSPHRRGIDAPVEGRKA